MNSLDPSRLPSLQELQTTRAQVEKEIEFLSTSHGQLMEAKAKCVDNMAMIDHLGDIPAGQPMLAAVSNSMFLPIELVENDRVITDIGAGFLIDRGCQDGKDHFQRKIDTIVDNVKKVETALVNKQNAAKFLGEAMRVKAAAGGDKD